MAALLVLPSGSVACAITAARLWRLDGLPSPTPNEPIHVLVPVGAARSVQGVRLHQVTIPPVPYVVGGVPCTPLPFTMLQSLAAFDFRSGFVFLEAVLHRQPGLVEALTQELRDRPPIRGRRRIDHLLDLADCKSESPLESRARLLWLEAGLPAPIQQAVICAAGRFIARVDFLWPEAMLIVEVDGLEKYAQRNELLAEKRRQNHLVAAGYTVLRFSWADITRNGAGVVAQLKAALAG